MIIKKYGIQLQRLTVKELELVRTQRNSDKVRKNMVYQDYISPEAQLKWFDSINTIYHMYLIVEFEGEKIGMINGKNTDFTKRTSEGGIFIWSESHLTSIIPALCSIIMHDYNFLICEFDKTIITVLDSNTNAIQFNKSFGYELVEKDAPNKSGIYELKKEVYLQKIEKYRKAIGHSTSDAEPLGESDFSFSNIDDAELIRLYNPLPVYLKEKANIILKKENRILLPV